MKTNKKITNTFNQNSSVFAVFKPHQLKKKNQNNFNLDVEKNNSNKNNKHRKMQLKFRSVRKHVKMLKYIHTKTRVHTHTQF